MEWSGVEWNGVQIPLRDAQPADPNFLTLRRPAKCEVCKLRGLQILELALPKRVNYEARTQKTRKLRSPGPQST